MDKIYLAAIRECFDGGSSVRPAGGGGPLCRTLEPGSTSIPVDRCPVCGSAHPEMETLHLLACGHALPCYCSARVRERAWREMDEYRQRRRAPRLND